MKKRKKNNKGMKKKIGILVLSLSVLLVAFVKIAPVTSNKILFQWGILNWGYLIIPLITVVIGRIAWEPMNNMAPRRTFILLFVALIINVVSFLSFNRLRNYGMYAWYTNFSETPELIPTDDTGLRYTSLQVAYTDMEGSVSSAVEDIDIDNVVPIPLGNGTGYIAPIIPDGFWQVYNKKNPGYLLFDDREGAKNRVQRIDQVQEVGKGMKIFDDIDNRLKASDWFATYDEPRYFVLDPSKPNVITAVVPKTKYAWGTFPKWGGVALVHANGTIEQLSPKEAVADERLKGAWIFPETLAKKQVEVQNLRLGIVNSLFRVTGKEEIPELPGKNQYPFATRCADEKDYFLTLTKADGGGGGTYRFYYIDMHTGKGVYYQPKSGENFYGPVAALERVPNLPGYNWHRKDGASESGNMQAVEPVPRILPGNQVWWKFSITNMEFKGTSGTAVANASDLNQLFVFENRSDFERWKNTGNTDIEPTDKKSTISDKSNEDLIQEMELWLKQGQSLLKRMKEE